MPISSLPFPIDVDATVNGLPLFESNPAVAEADADAPGTEADARACTGGNINGGGNGGKNGGLFLGISITFFHLKK